MRTRRRRTTNALHPATVVPLGPYPLLIMYNSLVYCQEGSGSAPDPSWTVCLRQPAQPVPGLVQAPEPQGRLRGPGQVRQPELRPEPRRVRGPELPCGGGHGFSSERPSSGRS